MLIPEHVNSLLEKYSKYYRLFSFFGAKLILKAKNTMLFNPSKTLMTQPSTISARFHKCFAESAKLSTKRPLPYTAKIGHLF